MLKNNKLLFFFTILFFLVAVSSLGYICYDNFKDDDKVDVRNKQNNGSTIKEVGEEELDINSRLVRSLYNKVGLVKNSSNRYESYKDNDNLLVKDMSDEDKLALVYSNLSSSLFDAIPNNDLEQSISIEGSNYNYDYELFLNSYGWVDFIDFSLVELEFKSLFGNNASFSKNSLIRTDSSSLLYYIYNDDLNGYIPYSTVGGYEGGISYVGKVVEAFKTSKNIVIKEEVTTVTPEGDSKSIGIYDYTFSIDDDGMYSFVSRIKE